MVLIVLFNRSKVHSIPFLHSITILSLFNINPLSYTHILPFFELFKQTHKSTHTTPPASSPHSPAPPSHRWVDSSPSESPIPSLHALLRPYLRHQLHHPLLLPPPIPRRLMNLPNHLPHDRVVHRHLLVQLQRALPLRLQERMLQQPIRPFNRRPLRWLALQTGLHHVQQPRISRVHSSIHSYDNGGNGI